MNIRSNEKKKYNELERSGTTRLRGYWALRRAR
jgi:hypothetical protein